MKKLITFLTLAMMFSSAWPQENPVIRIETGNTVLILKAASDQRLYQCYLGAKLNGDRAYDALTYETPKNFIVNDGNPLVNFRHLAYPTFGTDNLFEPAIRMTHNDGNPSLELFSSGTATV